MPAAQRRVTMRPGVRLVVDLLGDKWTVPIIQLLSSGPRRHEQTPVQSLSLDGAPRG